MIFLRTTSWNVAETFQSIFFLCLLLPFFAAGQTVQGSVIDGSESLPHVSVLLLAPDSTLVQGTVNDTTGVFTFDTVAPATYLISASMVGYKKFYSRRITIENKSVVLLPIILDEETTQLKELTITSEKQHFDHQPDKLIINLQSSITSSGNTVLEVIQKSPGVVVNKQSNTITMNGRSGVRVMINEKLVPASSDLVLQMLDGMSAANIEKIELITTPGTKYDAEGNGGIIHIVTKINDTLGTSGSLGLTLGYRWAETMGANFNVNHRVPKAMYYLDYSIVRNHNLHVLEIDRRSIHNSPQIFSVYGHRENVTTQQNLNAGVEWKLHEKISLSSGVTGFVRDWSMSAMNEDQNRPTSDSAIFTNMKIDQSNIWKSLAGSIGIETRINSKNSISLGADYLYYHNNNPSFYTNTSRDQGGTIIHGSEVDLSKTTPTHFFIWKVDYRYTPSSSVMLEAGLKGVQSRLDNYVIVQRRIDEAWNIDSAFTSNSNLRERVGAAYVSGQWDTGTPWHVAAGLRYEYTQTDMTNQITHSNDIHRTYGYFFPSILVKRSLRADRDLQFSYTRRITRPTYNDIASYASFWSPNTFTAANTGLWPAVADVIKLGLRIQQWSPSFQYTQVANEIVSLQPEVDIASNALIYRSQNLRALKSLALTNFYSFYVASWWEVQSNLIIQYQISETSHLQHNYATRLFGVNANLVNVIKLPKDFAIEVSGMYQSKSLSGISQFLPFGSLHVGVQKNLHTKGILRLSFDDILYTNNWRIRSYTPGNNVDVNFDYDWHNQFLRLSYTWNFGNSKLKSVRVKSAAEEERKRIGN